jgi:hypothetical protein
MVAKFVRKRINSGLGCQPAGHEDRLISKQYSTKQYNKVNNDSSLIDPDSTAEQGS